MKFAFRIYDLDNDGFISNGELFKVSYFFKNVTVFIINQFKGAEDDGGEQPKGDPVAADS